MPEEIKNTENQTESSEPISPTNGQQNQPIEEAFDPNYVRSLEQRIAEQQIQIRQSESKYDKILSKLEETKSSPAPVSRNIEEERKRFYEDPTGSLDSRLNERDNKILQQMQKMLEPIQEVASSFRMNNEYERMKAFLKNDPVFGKAMRDPDVESAIDSIMRQPGVVVDENTIKSAAAQAMGMKAMGAFGSRTPTNERERFDPPVVPTNRTRISKEAPVRKELTENDRLAMRMAGLKPGVSEHEDEYWKLVSDETMVLDTYKKKES